MSKILRMKDRIQLKIDDITFTLAPMNYMRKQELASCTKIEKGEEVFDVLASQFMYLKYSLKDVKGLKAYNDSDYELEFVDDSKIELTDDCVSEIMSIEQNSKLTSAAWQLLNGIQELKDPLTGKPMKGIELEVKSSGN